MSNLTEISEDLTPNKLIRKAARKYKVPVRKLRSKTRKQPIVEARQYATYLIREELKLSLHAIGHIMGYDHATVLHSYNQIKNRIELNQLLVN